VLSRSLTAAEERNHRPTGSQAWPTGTDRSEICPYLGSSPGHIRPHSGVIPQIQPHPRTSEVGGFLRKRRFDEPDRDTALSVAGTLDNLHHGDGPLGDRSLPERVWVNVHRASAVPPADPRTRTPCRALRWFNHRNRGFQQTSSTANEPNRTLNPRSFAHDCLLRIRRGSRSSSSFNPNASWAGAARPARRSFNWSTNAAVASVPSETLGSPFSRRQRGLRPMNRRAAMSSVEMPRYRRANAWSRPSSRGARAPGNGSACFADMNRNVSQPRRSTDSRFISETGLGLNNPAGMAPRTIAATV